MPEYQQTKKTSESKSNIQTQTALPKQIPVSHPMAIIQRVRINPKSLTHADVMQLQRTIGNRAVGQLLSEIGLISSKAKQTQPVQMQTIPEEGKESLQGKFAEPLQRQEIPDAEKEEPLQGKMIGTIQRQEIPEEEEPPLQGRFAEPLQRQEMLEEEEPLQGKFESRHDKEICPSCIQRQEIPEEEESLQGKMDKTIQLQEIPEKEEPLQGKFESIQRQEIHDEETLQIKKENKTGMPDNLKAGVENLSGIDMSDVRVHYNSSKPAEVGALAYTQGTNIHVAPRQEKHLPHETWHVVQQAQGRVRPTMRLKEGVLVNDDAGLEHDANVMGKKAFLDQKMQRTEENSSSDLNHVGKYNENIIIELPRLQETVQNQPTKITTSSLKRNEVIQCISTIPPGYVMSAIGNLYNERPVLGLPQGPVYSKDLGHRDTPAHVLDACIQENREIGLSLAGNKFLDKTENPACEPPSPKNYPTLAKRQTFMDALDQWAESDFSTPMGLNNPKNQALAHRVYSDIRNNRQALRNNAHLGLVDPFITELTVIQEGIATPWKIQTNFSTRAHGYVTKVTVGSKNITGDAIKHESFDLALQNDNPVRDHFIFSGRHDMHDLRTVEEQIDSLHEGATNLENNVGFDAVTKLVGEGSRFEPVRILGTNLKIDSKFYTRDPLTNNLMYVTLSDLYTCWDSDFNKKFGIPSADIRPFVINRRHVLPPDFAPTIHDYDLDH